MTNYMGYLIRCIQGRYFDKSATSVVEGSHKKAVAVDNLRKEANSEDTKKRIWESTKKKDDFETFLAYEEREKQLSFIELDELLSPAEAVAEYIEWKKAGEPA